MFRFKRILCALLCVSGFYHNQVFGQTLDSKPAGLYLYIQSPPAFASQRLRLSGNLDGASVPPNIQNVPLILPSTREPERTGCFPFQYASDNGVPIQGSILLIIGGNCDPSIQIINIANSGALGWISSYNVEVVDLIDTLQGHFPINLNLTNGKKPVFYHSCFYSDAVILANYLDSSTTSDLRVSITGTNGLNQDERNALLSQAQQFVNAGFPGDCNENLCGNLRTYQDFVNSPEIDPCIDRIIGIYCEGSNIIALKFTDKRITMDMINFDLLATYTQLRVLLINKNANLVGSIPESICNLSPTVLFMDFSYSQITLYPDCFQSYPGILGLDLSNNQITTFPNSLLQAPYLILVSLANNKITDFPSQLLNPIKQPLLSHFDISSNLIESPLPNFSGFSFLQIIKIDHNLFFFNAVSPIDESYRNYFNNLPQLTVVQATSNKLQGKLPFFINSTAIESLYLDYNQFTGGLPEEWRNLQSCSQLYLSDNQLNGLILPLADMKNLVVINLAYNTLISPFSDFSTYLYLSIPPKVLSLNLNHNQFCCTWNNAWPVHSRYLRTLLVAYNRLQQFSDSLCNNFLTSIDFSFNDLRGSIPNTCKATSGMLMMNFLGNPLFFGPNMPSFVQKNTNKMIASPQADYLCPSFSDPSEPDFVFSIDPSYYNYQGCYCFNGYYGTGNNCKLIPQSKLLRLPGPSPRPLPYQVLDISYPSQIWSVALNHSFMKTNPDILTDSIYGSSRYVPGMTTFFFINSVLLTGSTSVKSTKCLIFINVDDFDLSTDFISVFDGTTDQNAKLSFLIEGSDTTTMQIGINNALNYYNHTSTPSSSLSSSSTSSSVVYDHPPYYSNVAIFLVETFQPTTTLEYVTHTAAANHFTLEVYFSSQCPYNYYENPETLKCTLTPVCNSNDFSITIDECESSSDSRLVHYNKKETAICVISSGEGGFIPPTNEQIGCTNIQLGNHTILSLLVISLAMLLIGIIPFLFEIYDYIRVKIQNACSNTNNNENHQSPNQKTRKKLIISAIHGWWSIFMILSWILSILTMILDSQSAISHLYCELKIFGITFSYFLAFAFNGISASFLSISVTRKLRTRMDNLKLSVIICVGLSILLILFLNISIPSSYNMLTYIPKQLQSGMVVNFPACSLTSSPWLPIAIFTINVCYAFWSIWEILPAWIVVYKDFTNMNNKVNTHLQYPIKLLHDEQILIIKSVTASDVINIVTYLLIIILTYTNAIGIIKDTVKIQFTQYTLLATNLTFGILCHFFPSFLYFFVKQDPEQVQGQIVDNSIELPTLKSKRSKGKNDEKKSSPATTTAISVTQQNHAHVEFLFQSINPNCPITWIENNDFTNGSYRFLVSGHYKLKESIFFHPDQAYNKVISVEADNVVLDLNGFTIHVSERYLYRYPELQNNKFAIINVGRKLPGISNVNFFGNIRIMNGKLSSSPSYGILVSYCYNVFLQNLDINDCLISPISVNNTNGIIIDTINVFQSKDLNFSELAYIIQQMQLHLQAINSVLKYHNYPVDENERYSKILMDVDPKDIKLPVNRYGIEILQNCPTINLKSIHIFDLNYNNSVESIVGIQIKDTGELLTLFPVSIETVLQWNDCYQKDVANNNKSIFKPNAWIRCQAYILKNFYLNLNHNNIDDEKKHNSRNNDSTNYELILALAQAILDGNQQVFEQLALPQYSITHKGQKMSGLSGIFIEDGVDIQFSNCIVQNLFNLSSSYNGSSSVFGIYISKSKENPIKMDSCVVRNLISKNSSSVGYCINGIYKQELTMIECLASSISSINFSCAIGIIITGDRDHVNVSRNKHKQVHTLKNCITSFIHSSKHAIGILVSDVQIPLTVSECLMQDIVSTFVHQDDEDDEDDVICAGIVATLPKSNITSDNCQYKNIQNNQKQLITTKSLEDFIGIFA